MSEATPFGIYLHIPYCKAKCRYCDFYSAPGARGVPQSYVDALLRELAKNTRRPDTLYLRRQLRHPGRRSRWRPTPMLSHRRRCGVSGQQA